MEKSTATLGKLHGENRFIKVVAQHEGPFYKYNLWQFSLENEKMLVKRVIVKIYTLQSQDCIYEISVSSYHHLENDFQAWFFYLRFGKGKYCVFPF